MIDLANSLLMKQILTVEWNFDGVVISDYNAIGELLRHGIAADEKEAAKLIFYTPWKPVGLYGFT